MDKLCFEMPIVSQCLVSQCAYNVSNSCHARAITVGDGIRPGCDTFLKESRHTRKADQIAGIGACKISGCKFNEDFECQTDSVRVGMVQNQANCMTFSAR